LSFGYPDRWARLKLEGLFEMYSTTEYIWEKTLHYFTHLPLKMLSVSLQPPSAWILQGQKGSGLCVREADRDRSCAKLVMDLIRA